ncbi:hypothetical protein [Pseudomonas sp.]|uniref:hypothetical protein n=1 Tax=Pseudomonas sp. TaxID=306 RepID=UPI0028AD5E0E|nr:hypothetical protein [Pseudomonas sp.]
MEINKAVLDCMQQLRRRLRDEQQLDIRLSQPDAIQAMLAACLCSGDEATRELGRRLAIYSDRPALFTVSASSSKPTESNASVKIYRGQRVLG